MSILDDIAYIKKLRTDLKCGIRKFPEVQQLVNENRQFERITPDDIQILLHRGVLRRRKFPHKGFQWDLYQRQRCSYLMGNRR